ncbi:MAG: hypothetical protein CMJ40_08550 [Phycisphaerae bacterium]|nr:hypothetical protein [Phycisphaerae bacterium]|tara:strand:- start:588 stop:2903 length:2316 start_codon:yes stop_codon:yes gene_type:complete
MNISVVIPSYNHSRYIGSAIESVFVQPSRSIDVELVIVDDGSTDNSPEIIRDCLRNAPLARTILIEQENRGAHAAIMRGLSNAKGDYLAILNSDDAFLPDRFARMAEHMETGRDCLAYSLVEMVDEDDRPLDPSSPESTWYQDVLASAAACPTQGFAFLRNNPAVTSGNLIFSRSLYDRLQGFSEHKLSHDWDFLLRATFYTEPLFIPEVLMRYRVHPQNTTGQVQHLMAEEGRDGLNRFLALAKKGPPQNRLAPLPDNWPRYWPWFCDSIRPHFSDRPISEEIDPEFRPSSNPDPNMGTRRFDEQSHVCTPGTHTDQSDPRAREMFLMARPTPTTDGMDISEPKHNPSQAMRVSRIKQVIKRVIPSTILKAIKRSTETEPTPPENPGPSVDPSNIDVDPEKPVLLMAIHEASRTGAPLLALDVVRRMNQEHGVQCAVIYAGMGPLLEEFARHAWLIDGRLLNPWGRPSRYGQSIMKVLEQSPRRMAICNTAPTWYFARWIRSFGWRTISLVHDFATNSSPEDYRMVASSPDVVVYPCDYMKDVANEWAGLPEDHGHVHPQGLIRESFLDGDNDAARQSFRRRLGIDQDAMIVLGCGSLELRKGPELFLLTALAALRDGVDPKVHFVWVGSGAETYLDPTFWCTRDAARAGVANRIHFVGSMEDTEEAFRGSDVYLLTSREDPFPCVVHEAMACGLPIACFENSGGTPSMIEDGGGTTVPFGDVHALAKVVVEWTGNNELREKTGQIARTVVKDRYSMSRYVDWLLQTGLD